LDKIRDNIWVRLAIGVTIFALFLWLSYLLRQILIPLMLAFIVAYIFDPVIDFLEERKVPRAAAIGGILFVLIAIFAVSLFVVIPKVAIKSAELMDSFQKGFPELQEKLYHVVEKFAGVHGSERFVSDIESLFEALKRYVPQMLESVSVVLSTVVSGTLGAVGWIVNFLLFAVVSVYLLLDFDKITEKMRELVPPAYKEKTLEIVGKIDENLRAFFRGQIVVCTFLAVFYFIGLSLLGVPYALPIALAGGYGQIVPYLGTALAVLPAAVFALIEFGDWFHPFGALAVIALGQTMEGFVITPRIMSEKVGLHPVVIILAILVFSQLLGFLGVLFAVPIAAILKVLVEDAVARYKQSSLFANPDSK
jgi:predicted PurR-regulated permease PerM